MADSSSDSKNLVEVPEEISVEIRDALGSDKVSNTVVAISDEVGLDSVNQIDKFSRSILFLFQHKISLDNYPYILQNELGVDEETALLLAVYVGKAFIVSHTSDFFPKGEEFYQRWLGTAKSKGIDLKRRHQPTKSELVAETPSSPAVPEKPASPAPSESAPAAVPVAVASTPATVAPSSKKVVPSSIDIKCAKKLATPAPVAKQSSESPPAQLQFKSPDDLQTASPRILDQEPDDAAKLTARMKEEIQDIAAKSKATRPEIVAAWKKSKLYHAYVDMGNDSMQNGKSIGETFTFRKAEGKSYLTDAQFNAVSEISRSLLS